MKITRADLKKLIKEELEANMEEGMFGDMKGKLAGIGSKVLSTMEDVAMVPAQLGVGFILGIAFNEMPRKDFDVSEVTREMLVAFGNMASSEDWSPEQFAYDWKNMRKDELLAKYFDSGREGPFSRYNK
jgi:hypothetical protein